MKLLFKILTIVLLTTASYAMHSKHGLDGYEQNKIDAIKNARLRSNVGNLHFQEQNYIAALKEYRSAFQLDDNATYLYNIAKCLMELGDYTNAKAALLAALERDSINMLYYKTLVDCYIVLGIEKQELQKCLEDTKNPYSRIIAGLIYLKTGDKKNAKITFDDFIAKHPKMIITEDVKTLLRKM